MSDDLVKRLRYDCELAQQLGDEACVVVQAGDVRTILDRIEEQAAEIERLREAGQKLNDHACHDDDCQIVTHGVWSDPIPCTCGYSEAWQEWAALGDTQ